MRRWWLILYSLGRLLWAIIEAVKAISEEADRTREED